MKGLLISIIWTILILMSIIFISNYYIISRLNKHEILIFCTILSFSSFILGILIALYSSKKNCNSVNKKNLFKQGIRHVVYSLLGYFMVYYIRIIREPFFSIFKDKKMSYSIAQSFIIIMNSITATIINYYQSIDSSCKLSQVEIDKNLKKLDKYLNTKEKKHNTKKIEIRD